MKRFLRNIILWTIPIVALYVIVISLNAGPSTDYFYYRFTRPKAPSLVMGTSRAAQGIIPSVIDSISGPNAYNYPLFNYAFTIHNSPYGPCYLDALKKKFNGEKDGIFIVAVDPFAVSNYKKNFVSEGEKFSECDEAPANIHFTEMKPNFEYLLKNYTNDIRTLTGIKEREYDIRVHNDGWLEVNFPYDTALFRRNTAEKIKNYDEYVRKIKPSPERRKALARTIDYFEEYGNVFLVRIPVSPQMAEIEMEYYPGFEEEIHRLAQAKEVPYLNYFHLNEQLNFTDGNHLHKSSSETFSAILGEDLKNLLDQR